MQAVAQSRRVSFARYAQRRIGHGTDGEQIVNLLARPFAAPSFAAFWRAFNPFYGYYLSYWVYRPLHRLMPRAAAELVTFAVSGFVLHDVPLFVIRRDVGAPWLTVWFVLVGAIAIVAEGMRMDLSRWPAWARVGVNLTYLLGTMSLVVGLSLAV